MVGRPTDHISNITRNHAVFQHSISLHSGVFGDPISSWLDKAVSRASRIHRHNTRDPDWVRDAQPEAALEHDVGSGSSLDKRVVEADETSNALEQRAPKTKMEWLSHRENFILRELAKQIENNVYPDDLVLFIGNSGR